jgi:hypothetical protein
VRFVAPDDLPADTFPAHVRRHPCCPAGRQATGAAHGRRGAVLARCSTRHGSPTVTPRRSGTRACTRWCAVCAW